MSCALQAREEYDDALSSGQQAFLLEESEQSPDIFSLSVGSLPPGESASIRLEYVTELAVQADDGLRFCLPAVLNPRYQPQGRKSNTNAYIRNQKKSASCATNRSIKRVYIPPIACDVILLNLPVFLHFTAITASFIFIHQLCNFSSNSI